MVKLVVFFLVWSVTTVTSQRFRYSDEEIDVSEQNFYVCNIEDYVGLYKYGLQVTMVKSTESLLLFTPKLESFRRIVGQYRLCREKEVELILRPLSFAMLPNGDLIHFHGDIVVRASHVCFIPRIDYFEKLSYAMLKVEARVCIDIPKVRYCCTGNETIERSNDAVTTSCVPGTKKAPTRRTLPVTFDHDKKVWNVKERVKGLPDCNGGKTIISVIDSRPGYLHYVPQYMEYQTDRRRAYFQFVSSRLQLRWEHPSFGKWLNLDSPEYCVGESAFGGKIFSPVVAYCQYHIRNRCKDKSVCFSKCCADEQLYDLKSEHCKDATFADTLHMRSLPLFVHDGATVHGMPRCREFSPVGLDPSKPDHIKFLSDGRLYVSRQNKILGISDYCADVFEDGFRLMAMVCSVPEEKANATVPYEREEL